MKVEAYRAMVAAQEDEHTLQKRVATFIEQRIKPDVPWTAVDHAAALSMRQGADRKRRGVKRGQPDFRFILPPFGRSAEIELKRAKGGKLSPEQREWERRVLAVGGLYLVCRSVAEVEGAMAAWSILR